MLPSQHMDMTRRCFAIRLLSRFLSRYIARGGDGGGWVAWTTGVPSEVGIKAGLMEGLALECVEGVGFSTRLIKFLTTLSLPMSWLLDFFGGLEVEAR